MWPWPVLFESGSDDAVVHWLPLNKCPCLLLRSIPTPWMWFSSLSEYRMVILSLQSFPCAVNLISLIPRIYNSYFFISFSTRTIWPHWYNVQMFQVPIVVMLLALKIWLVWVSTSLWVWSMLFFKISCTSSGVPSPLCHLERVPGWLLLAVSIACPFWRGGGHWPHVLPSNILLYMLFKTL